MAAVICEIHVSINGSRRSARSGLVEPLNGGEIVVLHRRPGGEQRVTRRRPLGQAKPAVGENLTVGRDVAEPVRDRGNRVAITEDVREGVVEIPRIMVIDPAVGSSEEEVVVAAAGNGAVVAVPVEGPSS